MSVFIEYTNAFLPFLDIGFLVEQDQIYYPHLHAVWNWLWRDIIILTTYVVFHLLLFCCHQIFDF